MLALAGAQSGVRLGLASQRSTFLVWDRASGEALTPVISWQDRRAHAWCQARRDLAGMVLHTTGLPLSPHYLGPKLAALMEEDRRLGERLVSGEVLVGTLDAWLTWTWTAGARFETDLTMAARTLLADPAAGTWSMELLERFGIPEGALPRVAREAERAVKLRDRGTLVTGMADQAAGLSAVVRGEDAVLVNLGTGVFVLKPQGTTFAPKQGYLVGPRMDDGHEVAYATEGTINGGGSALAPYGPGPTALPDVDPTPGAFCLPDRTGVGSPHWRSDVPFCISEELPLKAARRVVLEGIVFRVREILDDLCPGTRRKVFLAGGLTREPFLPKALAACLGRTVEVLDEPHATLLGVARKAGGLPAFGSPRTREVKAGPAGAYLKAKYDRWRGWMAGLL